MDALGLDVRFLRVPGILRSAQAVRVDTLVLGKKLGMVYCISVGVVISVSKDGSLVETSVLYRQMLASH